MKKAYILTFFYSTNYGSKLQATALGKQLESMGITDYYVYLDDYYDEKVGNKVVRREDMPAGESKIPTWKG